MKLAPLLVLVVFLTACGGSSGSSDSGIRGRAIIMSCGVPFTEEECQNPPPYVGEINIRRSYGGEVVKTIRSGEDGRFEVELAPGRYVLESEDGLPFLKAVGVTVQEHRFTVLELGFDSGIR